MLYVVFFTDDPARADQRQRLMADHLDFLERHSAQVRSAGALTETSDGSPAGGMWLVEAPDAAAVAKLYRADPLWPSGLRKSVRVLEWTQVFGDGRRLR